MAKKDSAKPPPSELCFCWYERKAGEEHAWYRGQLCGSMHRLGFIQGELETIKKISDIDLALERLAYHMENYLVRIYELSERALKLLAVFAECGIDEIGLLKAKKKEKKEETKKRRENLLKGLTVKQSVSDTYLQLLPIMDDDIALRHQNTHDTFLSFGLYTGDNFYDPHDVLLDTQHQKPKMYGSFKKRLREEMKKTAQRYEDKIAEIIQLTMKILKQLDYKSK